MCWSLFKLFASLCEYCKILKNTYFEEHLQTAPSIMLRLDKVFARKIETKKPVPISETAAAD